MRQERLSELLHLAILLQGRRRGMSIGDICAEFAVGRRTAERMRDAVEAAFGALEQVERGDGRRRYWRLESRALPSLVHITDQEMAQLKWAADAVRHTAFHHQVAMLEIVIAKLAALSRPRSDDESEAEIEALMGAEGVAMRPGPRAFPHGDLLVFLREAISAHERVSFEYLSRSSGKIIRQRVAPLGLLYGNRAFLVARNRWAPQPRLWRLANIREYNNTGDFFDPDPDFDLRAFAARSFGTFQEEPVEVVLRFAPGPAADDAADFLFHPSQRSSRDEDGTLRVSFRAGGIQEMCWHLATWGEAVVVEQPPRLRRRLAALGKTLAAHHRG